MKIYDKSEREYATLSIKENAVALFETDKKIDIDDLLSINGKLYSIGIMGKDYCFVEELKVSELNDEPEDMDYTNEIKCPYCESEIESWEMPDENYDYECPYCHSHYSYQRVVTIEYCSQPISKGNAVTLN